MGYSIKVTKVTYTVGSRIYVYNVVVVAVCREATITTFIFTLQLLSIQIVD